MNKKAKNILTGVVAFAGATSPITTLAYNNIDDSSTYSSNLENLNSRGVQAGYYTVTGAINFRKSASWSGTVISTISKGTTVYVSSISNGWATVSHNGTTGYAPADYLQAVSKKETVTASVNLRTTATWSGDIIQVIKTGETVHTVSTSGEFSKVLYNGKTGYIATKYITSSTNTNSNNNTNTNNSSSSSSSKVDVVAMSKTGKVVKVKSGDTLNVRTGTNSSDKIIGTLAPGATVSITGQDKLSGWYRVNYNGQTGFVSDYYIEIVNQTSTSTGSYKKTTTNLNMRSGPGTSHSIITEIPNGALVTVLSTTNGWDYIEYNGKKGYCNNKYLTSATQQKKTTANLNMRKGPSTSYDKIATIPTGTVIDVLSTSNGWSKVRYNGQEGYVSDNYLTTVGSSSNASGNLPASKPAYSKRTVVIDPGHGGSDPGAIGFGRNEKDIALNISKKINANLKTLGFKTIMTRSTDVYVTLSNRYTIANNNNADLFVSVHLNSASSSANGIETLYKGSKNFANDIQTEMISATGARDRGLKYRSDLAVLNGTKMPASLVEVGFISNNTESDKLATSSYQDKLATSITKGIAKYTDKL